jgi:hypothetical protein
VLQVILRNRSRSIRYDLQKIVSPNCHRKPARNNKTDIADIIRKFGVICFLQVAEGRQDAKIVRRIRLTGPSATKIGLAGAAHRGEIVPLPAATRAGGCRIAASRATLVAPREIFCLLIRAMRQTLNDSTRGRVTPLRCETLFSERKAQNSRSSDSDQFSS